MVESKWGWEFIAQQFVVFCLYLFMFRFVWEEFQEARANSRPFGELIRYAIFGEPIPKKKTRHQVPSPVFCKKKTANTHARSDLANPRKTKKERAGAELWLN